MPTPTLTLGDDVATLIATSPWFTAIVLAKLTRITDHLAIAPTPKD